MVIKGFLAVLWLAAVPASVGLLFTGRKQLKISELFLHGYILLFAVMEILVLPMILLKMPLHILTSVYGILAAGFAAGGLLLWKKKNSSKNLLGNMERPSIYFWMAVLVIVLQVLMCAAMAHMDADDCFYVAAATTDVHTDSFFAVDPYTGCEYRVLPRRYVLSPFPVFLAVASRLSGGMHPAVMAHMVFPVIFLPMAYMVQYCLAEKMFSGERKAKDIYLLLTACICSFSGIFCIQYREFSNGSDLAGKGCSGICFTALPAVPLYLDIFGRKKKKFMDSSFSDQYQLLSFVLHGDYPGTAYDRVFSGSILCNAKRVEDSGKRSFVLSSLDCFGCGIHFDRLTGGQK